MADNMEHPSEKCLEKIDEIVMAERRKDSCYRNLECRQQEILDALKELIPEDKQNLLVKFEYLCRKAIDHGERHGAEMFCTSFMLVGKAQCPSRCQQGARTREN